MKHDHVAFQVRLVPLLEGDVSTALLLSQIYYWYRPREKTGGSKLGKPKLGKWWIAKSTKGWQEETGLSADQVRRGIEVLVAKNLIEVEVLKFNGAPTRHIRLTFTQGNQVLNGVEELIHLCLNSISSGPQPQSLIQTTVETTKKKKRGSLSLAATPEENFPPTQLGENMKGEERKTLVQVLEGVKKKPAEPSMEGVKLTATSIANYWRSLVRYFGHADFTHPPTKKELGIWAQMIKLEPQLLPVIVRHVVEDWDGFSRDAMMSSGMKGRPMDPMVEYLRKHLTIAVNWYTTKTAPKVVPKVVPAPKPSTVYVVNKEQVVTNSEPVDWAKIEAEIAQEQDEGNFGEPSS